MAKILVIDDEPEIARLYSTWLADCGHEVREAANGRLGLLEFARLPADLVICDLFMPEKEGIETIRELRALTAAPIIAISGGALDFAVSPAELLKIAGRLGASAVMRKPIPLAELRATVERLLGEV